MYNIAWNLKIGAKARIVDIEGGLVFVDKMESRGIHTGKEVEIISKMGPIVIKIDNFKMAIGRWMAKKIIVEEI